MLEVEQREHRTEKKRLKKPKVFSCGLDWGAGGLSSQWVSGFYFVILKAGCL